MFIFAPSRDDCFLVYLHSKETDTSRSLHENPLPWLQGLEAVQSIPSGDARVRQCCALDIRQILREAHETGFLEDAVLLKSTVDRASNTAFGICRRGDGSGLLARIEQCRDAIAYLPPSDFRADLYDFACSVGAADHGDIECVWEVALPCQAVSQTVRGFSRGRGATRSKVAFLMR